MSPVLVGALLGSTVAYLKKIGKIPYTLEESLDIIMSRPIGDDVTWNNDVEVIGDEVEWKAPAPKQQKVKFPRAKADKIVKKVEKHLKPYVDKMMACGSYRRGAQMIGDIDFVVILKEGYSLPEILPANQGVNWVGDQKAQVIIDGEKVDFRVTTPEAWGATILYFTGPADFNIKYRWMAKKRGLKLSEYGLFDRNTDKYIAGKTENDIFTAMGRPYRDPADRKGFQRSAKKKAEFEAPYQPNQSLADYSPEMLKYSSAVTGDFFWDSLKFGQTTRNAETAEDSLKVYRRMSWEQYFDALDTGYLMPTEMRMKLDGFVSNKSWSVSDRFNTSRTPLFDSPLAHLQADVLPIFEIELLPEDKLHPTFEKAKNGRLPVIDVLSAIPVERVTPFSTSEQVSSFDAEDNYDSLKYGFGPTTLRAEGDTFRVYRRMSWEQYFDALETGYLMSPKMRNELDGFVNSKSFMLQDLIYAATSPSWKSPLSHLQDNLLPTFEIELLPTDDFKKFDSGVVEIKNAIPVDRVTPFSTTEEISFFEAEDNYEATYGKEQAKIRRRLKKKIMAQAIMGTKAGQWSARKSQELKRQYEAACSKKGLRPYKGNKTKSQDNLSKWSRQKWGTASGKKSSKTGEPYFPAKAIEALKDRGLYAKAKRQKQAATKAGKQHARYSDDIREVVKPFRADSQVNEGLQYLLDEIKTTWYVNMTAIENWVEHEMAGDGLLNYWDLMDLPDGTQIDENTTKREYFDKNFESFLNRFQKDAQVGICERGLEIVGQRVLYVPVGKKVNLKSLGNWENRRADRYGVFDDPITSWTWSGDIYTGVVFGDDSIDHMEGQEGVDFDRIVLAAWIPWEAVDWASTIAFNISSHWQEHELCVNDKEPLYEVDIYRNGILESSSDKAMNAESQHPICPLCHGFIPNDKTPGAYPGAMSRVFENMEICSSCGTAEAVGPMFGPLDDLIDEAKEQGLSGLELWSYVISNVKEYLPKELYGAESFAAEGNKMNANNLKKTLTMIAKWCVDENRVRDYGADPPWEGCHEFNNNEIKLITESLGQRADGHAYLYDDGGNEGFIRLYFGGNNLKWDFTYNSSKPKKSKFWLGAESFESIDIMDMDRYLQNRRFKPINLIYRNRPVKEWVYERKMGIPNHYVRVYTSINRYGRNQGRARDSGRDAIRVQVIYRDQKGETLVSAPKRVHRIGTWKDNLQKRLDVIAEELPKVMFDSRGEPMTLRKHKGNYFWGSRDYPKYKETRRFQSETEEELSWQVIVVADPQDNNFYQAYQRVIEADNYNEIWEIVELVDDLNLATNKIADTKFNERRVIITVYTPGVGLTAKDDYWCEEFDEMLETL